MKIITLFFFKGLLLISLSSFAQVTVSLGTYTGSSSTNSLLATSTSINNYSRTISLYTASEIHTAGGIPGIISKLAWDKHGIGEYTTSDAYIKIYLKHVNNATWNSAPEWDTEVVGATEVFTSSTYSIPIGTGWKEVPFTTPFTWNGLDNIAIFVEWNRASLPTHNISWGRSSIASTNATRVGSTSLDELDFLINGARPLVQLTIETLGTTYNKIEGFVFYPNPSSTIINLIATKPIENVLIYNLLGQKVLLENVSSVTSQLDISALASGIYMMQVTSNGQTGIYKIIKE